MRQASTQWGSLDRNQIFYISYDSRDVQTTVLVVGRTAEPVGAFAGGIKNEAISFLQQSQKKL